MAENSPSSGSGPPGGGAAPPMSAFKSLILTKNHRVKKKKVPRNQGFAKSPIDPMVDLNTKNDEEDNNSDSNSESYCDSSVLTDDLTQNTNSIGLFDNLRRNWSKGEDGVWEQACFAALCTIFYDSKADHPLPPPHRCVVTGLWSHVVLPFYLKDNQSKIPELVAEEIWNVLTSRLQYITEDEHNTVSLTHTVYNDYGLKLAQNADTDKWKHEFADFIQNSLDGEQPHFVQLYASQVIVPYWLYLNQPGKAAALLHQPTFISKEWRFLSKQENPLQITLRHIKQVELYLSKLPKSPTKWQEALGLYQGWHNLLQQEVELIFGRKSDNGSDNKSHGSGSSAKKKKRKEKSERKTKKTDPAKLLMVGRSLYILSMSLDKVLTELPSKDVTLSVLWRFQAEYLSEAMQVYSQLELEKKEVEKYSDLCCLLLAAAWIGMSSSCATIEECSMDGFVDLENLAYLCDAKDEFTGESDELRCLSVAKALLEDISASKKCKTLQLIYWSLKAELEDSFGRWFFFKQRYLSSREPLEEAVKMRRQVLSALKETHAVTLFWWGSSTSQESENDIEKLCQQLCLNLGNIDTQTQKIEISLAQSLEYGALTLHACDMSMAAMSWLQEALILKQGCLGKFDLEISRLNSSMAVIHEDMMQWEAALERYRECLRIRMHFIEQSNPRGWFNMQHELFHSTLGTLGSMGTAYRMLGDQDNAVGCFWKIASMAKANWEKLSASNNGSRCSFWGFHAHRQMATDLRPTPLPIFVLDEERLSIFSSRAENKTTPYSMKRKGEYEEENAILSQAAQAYQIIMSLFEDKMRDTMSVSSKSKASHKSGPKMPHINLANCIAAEDVPILLAASYYLGLIHAHFGDFRSAFAALEHSLNALWVIDPNASESGSSSDDSSAASSSASSDEGSFADSFAGSIGRIGKRRRRKRQIPGVFGNEMDNVQDEGVYHVLGICRAACGEHEQAVRFHLTALRCARRMYGVNSLRASEILCDAANSYWYSEDYDKANEFWSECLRIRAKVLSTSNKKRLSNPNNSFSDVTVDSNIAEDNKIYQNEELQNLQHAAILYNTAASLCAQGKYSDPRALAKLEEAKSIFVKYAKDPNKSLEVANCLFYSSMIKFRTSANQDKELLAAASDDLNRASSMYQSLGYVGSKRGKKGSATPNNALKAHVQFLQASISENGGRFHHAMEMYTTALGTYRELNNKKFDSYIASVHNQIGKLHAKMFKENEALEAFENALKIRRRRLGRDHKAVGETLYHLANVHGKLDNLDIAMGMFHEALRIQTASDGGESASVATTLMMIASIYMKQGDNDAALEKLNGALTIRQRRVQKLGASSSNLAFWSGDIANDYLAIFRLGKEEVVDRSDSHIGQVIEDDVLERHESFEEMVDEQSGNTKNTGDSSIKKENPDITEAASDIKGITEGASDIKAVTEEGSDNKGITEETSDIKDVEEDLSDIKDIAEESSDEKDVTEETSDIKDVEEDVSDIKDVTEETSDIKDVEGDVSDIKDITEEVSDIKEEDSSMDSSIKEEDLVSEETKADNDGPKKKLTDENETEIEIEKEEVGLAIVLHCMGNVSVRLKEHDRAKNYFLHSLRAYKRHAKTEAISQCGTVKVSVADTFHNLGCIYELQKDYPAALMYYTIALKLKYRTQRMQRAVDVEDKQSQELIMYSGKETLDNKYLNCSGSLSYAATLHRIGTVQHRCGSADLALAYLDSALKMQKQIVGVHHYTTAQTLVDIGSVLRRMEGQTEAARQCYIDAYEIRKLRNQSDTDVGHVLFHIGSLYDNDMKHAQATSYYYQSLRAYGHSYAMSMINHLCHSVLRKSLSLEKAKKLEDLFSSDMSLAVPSIEDTDDRLVANFRTVAKAIHDISKKRLENNSNPDAIAMDFDVDAPDCLISLQLYILGLVEFINNLSKSMSEQARLQSQHAMRQLAQAGKDGMKTNSDAITFQMLYLIQE